MFKFDFHVSNKNLTCGDNFQHFGWFITVIKLIIIAPMITSKRENSVRDWPATPTAARPPSWKKNQILSPRHNVSVQNSYQPAGKKREINARTKSNVQGRGRWRFVSRRMFWLRCRQHSSPLDRHFNLKKKCKWMKNLVNFDTKFRESGQQIERHTRRVERKFGVSNCHLVQSRVNRVNQ